MDSTQADSKKTVTFTTAQGKRRPHKSTNPQQSFRYAYRENLLSDHRNCTTGCENTGPFARRTSS